MDNSINFDRAAEYYDETRGFPDGVAPKVGSYIAERLALNDTTHLLEVGIGTGRIAAPLAPHVGNITGIDISPAMMKKIYDKPQTENIQVALADAHHMPFGKNIFDAVYITHVLHLVHDPVQVLEEIKRVAKTGAYFIHMRNHYSNTHAMQKVVDAWNDGIEQKLTSIRRWDDTNDSIREAGISLAFEHVYRYKYTSELRVFLERIEKRQWSSTWQMTDATIQKGLAAVFAVIDAEFDGNRDYETEAEGSFKIQVYETA